MRSILAIFLVNFLLNFTTIQSCTSFYCINSCGASSASNKKGFKFILANNRDEDIYRLTTSAKAWPPKDPNAMRYARSANNVAQRNTITCDQSSLKPPYNVCAFGPLDLKIAYPPTIYSTWLGLNERGTVGNLLFYMGMVPWKGKYSRGVVVSNSIMNSSWPDTPSYMKYLDETRDNFEPYNYIESEMSPTTGNYNMYYFNNVQSDKSYVKLNPNEIDPYIFGISNSNPQKPFNKVVMGEGKVEEILKKYSEDEDKESLKNSLLLLLQNTTDNYPDKNLEEFMKVPIEKYVREVSRVKATYPGGSMYTRTSTIILIDYDDNVEYFEYNLTSWSKEKPDDFVKQVWLNNSFTFKLKPLHKLDKEEEGITLEKDKNGSSKLIGLGLINALLASFISLILKA